MASIDRPLPKADEIFRRLLERQAEDALERMGEFSSFAEIVRCEIAKRIESSGQATAQLDVSAEIIAEGLGLSDRTVRRRLRECGVRYQQLLDGVRCERARVALSQPGTTVGEVAFSLGFSDTSAFHKAFRRWTGMRPSDWQNGAR